MFSVEKSIEHRAMVNLTMQLLPGCTLGGISFDRLYGAVQLDPSLLKCFGVPRPAQQLQPQAGSIPKPQGKQGKGPSKGKRKLKGGGEACEVCRVGCALM